MTSNTSSTDSPRAITAHALKFIGLIVTCAGALAIIRTGERSVFYAMLMPVGLVMWGVGFYMAGKTARNQNNSET